MKLLLPSAFGALMVGAGAYHADGAALIAAVAVLIAVLIAGWWRPCAMAAVLLTLITIVLADPAPLYTALAGLAATAYLVLRHEDPTRPTMLFAVVFAAAAAIAVVAPVNVAWLPLAAPLVLLAGYLLALRPYLIRNGMANRV